MLQFLISFLDDKENNQQDDDGEWEADYNAHARTDHNIDLVDMTIFSDSDESDDNDIEVLLQEPEICHMDRGFYDDIENLHIKYS